MGHNSSQILLNTIAITSMLLSVSFTGPIGIKLGRNVNWMVLYILFPDRNLQMKKRPQSELKQCFLFLYMGFLFLHWFWWVFFMFLIIFLFYSFTLCSRENVTPVIIMVIYRWLMLKPYLLHQNLLFFIHYA